jgi:hypothetical protein
MYVRFGAWNIGSLSSKKKLLGRSRVILKLFLKKYGVGIWTQDRI